MKTFKNISTKDAVITGIFVLLAAIITGIFTLMANSDFNIKQKLPQNQSSSSVAVNNNQNNINSSIITNSVRVKLNDFNVFNTQFLSGEKWSSTDLVKWNPLSDNGADGNEYKDGFLLQIFQPFHKVFKVEFLLNKQYDEFSTDYLLSEKMKSTSAVCIFKIIGDDKELFVSPKITGGFTPSQTGVIGISSVTKLTIQVESSELQHGNSGGILLTNPEFVKK